MRVVPDDQVVACLSFLGRDSDGLLQRLFAAIPNLNIEKFEGVTMLDHAGILAHVVGTADEIEKAKAALAKAERPGEWLRLEEVDDHKFAIQSVLGMLPFPWRLKVLAPDERGLLTGLCSFLYKLGVKVIGCHGELYDPRQSPVAGRTASDLRLTILLPKMLQSDSGPIPFDRGLFEVGLDAKCKRENWLDWELSPLS